MAADFVERTIRLTNMVTLTHQPLIANPQERELCVRSANKIVSVNRLKTSPEKREKREHEVKQEKVVKKY